MKKKFSIFYLPPAEKDLEGIFDYIRRDSLSRASHFLEQVDRAIKRLGQFPASGIVPNDRHLRQKGYRVVVMGNDLAFYRVKRRVVIIYRIVHGKRRYEFLL